MEDITRASLSNGLVALPCGEDYVEVVTFTAADTPVNVAVPSGANYVDFSSNVEFYVRVSPESTVTPGDPSIPATLTPGTPGEGAVLNPGIYNVAKNGLIISAATTQDSGILTMVFYK